MTETDFEVASAAAFDIIVLTEYCDFGTVCTATPWSCVTFDIIVLTECGKCRLLIFECGGKEKKEGLLQLIHTKN